MISQNNIVIIKFDEIWKKQEYNLDEKEIDFLKNGRIFGYDENTSIRDILLYINNTLRKFYSKKNLAPNTDLKMSQYIKNTYRIVYNDKLIYFFDLDIKVKNIIKYTNTNIINIFITSFLELGGCVASENGIDFYIHSKENGKHHIPHVHVKYCEYEAVISLNAKILEGDLPSKKLKYAIKIIKINKESFLYHWNCMTDGKKFKIENNEFVRVL